MNWDAITAVAQLAATVGLFISIAYLALQVRQSTMLTRITAEQAAVNTFREVTQPVAIDPVLGRVWQTGLGDMNELSPEDRARFFHVAFYALKGAESVHSSYVNGIMDADTWSGWHGLFAQHLTSPGIRQYWALRSDFSRSSSRATSPPFRVIT